MIYEYSLWPGVVLCLLPAEEVLLLRLERRGVEVHAVLVTASVRAAAPEVGAALTAAHPARLPPAGSGAGQSRAPAGKVRLEVPRLGCRLAPQSALGLGQDLTEKQAFEMGVKEMGILSPTLSL